MKKIERLRNELRDLALQRGLQDALVIKKSQQLDKLIVHYMRKIPRRKAPIVPKQSADGIKMNYFFSRVRGAMRRDLDDYFRRVEQLQQEVEQLAQDHHLFDPVVMEKSRELDRLLMSCIRPSSNR